ncbi:MAG: hypothetical protein RIM23_25335 [Coleofasciculus sp. G3-WIS-01]|uniref:hypothetical protein n=1 Tax=Coleofasciculus sp. G3-WIS-01 TaxID=3069528 RepID=UPI0032F3D215
MDQTNPSDPQAKTKEQIKSDTYDRNIVPAETAARKEREGDNYKAKITQDKQSNPDSIDTTEGYTVDNEGLVNNFAIEPEMYVNEPGDLRQKEEQETAKRRQELQQLDEERQGELTMEKDERGRGPGLI